MVDSDPNERLQDVFRQQNSNAIVDDVLDACAPHQRGILGVLAVSHCHGMDLVGMLENLAAEVPKSYSRLVRRFADQIKEGGSVAAALVEVPGLLPMQAVMALQVAESDESHNMLYQHVLSRPAALSNIPFSPRQQMLWKLVRKALAYTVAFGVFLFFAIRVIPEFKDMCEEFGMELPAIMEVLAEFSRWSALPVAIALATVFLLSPILIQFLIDALQGWNVHAWKTMKMTGAARRRKLLALKSGTALDPEHEQDRLVDSARNLVSRSELKAIQVAESAETRAWLLHFFAARYQQQEESRSILILNVVIGIANVLFSLFVLTIALSVFITLISIIEGLSQW